MRFHAFTRSWWVDNFDGTWPNDLEPCAGDKHTLGVFRTEQAARDRCSDYNATHSPGRYSVKAEYDGGS